VNTAIKTALLMSFCVGILTTPLRGQEKNMSISFDPMGLLNGAIPLTFRVMAAEHFSFGLSGYDKVFSLSKVKVSGVGGGLSGKFHLSAPAFTNGWYIKPEIMAGYWSIGETPDRSEGYGVEPRLVAGYDWIWSPGFTISLGLGIKYAYLSIDKAKIKDLASFGFYELFPNAELNIGWAF
jgi:hypothetical protein